MTEHDPLTTLMLITHPFTGAGLGISDLERDDLARCAAELHLLRAEVRDYTGRIVQLEAALKAARAEARLWEQEARRG